MEFKSYHFFFLKNCIIQVAVTADTWVKVPLHAYLKEKDNSFYLVYMETSSQATVVPAQAAMFT